MYSRVHFLSVSLDTRAESLGCIIVQFTFGKGVRVVQRKPLAVARSTVLNMTFIELKHSCHWHTAYSTAVLY